ncbi:MAG: arylesterase [Bdellovibrionaceae bacterium]|nr:arylesterase [Pseudobdellovibrionaceae bacterium]
MKNFKNCFFFTFSFLALLFCSQYTRADDKPIVAKTISLKKMVFLGDSLTEGYGVDSSSTYTHLLQEKFDNNKIQWTVVNAGISGSTTASAVSRINWILKGNIKPDLFIIILGANDGLRGQKISGIKKNLSESIDILLQQKIPVILGQVQVPPNYGKEYSESFKNIFPQLAKDKKIPLMPFILEKVAGIPELNIEDGIHPNEKGHKIIFEQVFKYLEKEKKL